MAAPRAHITNLCAPDIRIGQTGYVWIKTRGKNPIAIQKIGNIKIATNVAIYFLHVFINSHISRRNRRAMRIGGLSKAPIFSNSTNRARAASTST